MSKQILEKLNEIFKAQIEDMGYELIDIEFTTEMNERYLTFYIYHPDGITVDDCERVSKHIDPQLDELDLIKRAYNLSVSSPDLSRPLKSDDDLRRNLNQLLDFSLYRKINNKKNYQAELIDYDQDTLTIKEGDNVIMLDRKDVSKIAVAIVF